MAGADGQTRRPGSALGTGMVLALVSSALFALSGPLAKPLLESGWSPGAAVLVRIGGSALLLLVPTLVLATRNAPAMRRDWRLLVAYGLFPIAGAQLGFFSAIQTLPVGMALLIEYLAPVYVVLWLWLRRGQRPGPLTVVGSAIAVLGLVLVLDPFSGQGVDPVGVAWAVFASIGVVVYFLLSARVSDDLSPVLVIGSGMIIGWVALALAMLVGILPVAMNAADATLNGVTMPWWGYATALVILATVLAYVTGIAGVGRLGPRLGSFVALAEVLFAATLSWLLLGQAATASQLIGGLSIIAGVILVRLGESPADPLKAAVPPDRAALDDRPAPDRL